MAGSDPAQGGASGGGGHREGIAAGGAPTAGSAPGTDGSGGRDARADPVDLASGGGPGLGDAGAATDSSEAGPTSGSGTAGGGGAGGASAGAGAGMGARADGAGGLVGGGSGPGGGGVLGATTGSSSGGQGGGSPGLQVSSQRTSSPETTLEIDIGFALGNAGMTGIDLATVTIRYYFTADGCSIGGMVNRCDVSQLNKRTAACPSARFVALASPKPAADSYLELTLTGAGSLAAGSSGGYEYKGGFFRPPYDCPFQQANDYSFKAIAPQYTPNQTMTAYVNGVLVWGAEP